MVLRNNKFKAILSEKNKLIRIYYKDKKIYEYVSIWDKIKYRIESAKNTMTSYKNSNYYNDKMKRIDQGDIKPKYGFMMFIAIATILLEVMDSKRDLV